MAPEVEEDDLAPVVGELEFLSGGVLAGDLGGGLADAEVLEFVKLLAGLLAEVSGEGEDGNGAGGDVL